MITDRTFIEDQFLVHKILEQLEPVEGDRIYEDSHSEQEWERYGFEIEDVDYQLKSAYGLRRYPYPEINEIIKIILNSQYMDEVAGACGLLRELEWNKRIKFREKLRWFIS